MQTQTEVDDRNWAEAKEVFEHGPAPIYYRGGAQDLYALFIEKYGLSVWLRHVEMECMQYLWRCAEKSDYVGDITKVKVICERILHEMSKPRPTP